MEKYVSNQSNRIAGCLNSYTRFAFISLVIAMTTFFKVNAQYSIEWDKVYGSTDAEERSYIMNSEDGGYVTCIASYETFTRPTPSGPAQVLSQFWIQKTDSDGNIVWDVNYGSDKADNPTCVLKVEGGYLIGGNSFGERFDRSRGSRGEVDYWVIKIDEMGNLLWENSFGGNRNDLLKTIVYNNSTYRLIGESDSDSGGDKSGPRNSFGKSIWEVIIGLDGRLIDENTYNHDYVKSVTSAAVKSNSEMYVLADYSHPVVPGIQRIALVLANDSGASSLITYDYSRYLSNGIIEKTTDGYLIAANSSINRGSWSKDYYAIKINYEGRVVWQRNYGTSRDENLTSLINGGDFFVLGGSSNGNSELDKSQDSRGRHDYWLLKIDRHGNVLSDHTYGGNNDDMPTSMVFDGRNHIITGISHSGVSGDKSHPAISSEYGRDIWTLKLQISKIPEVDWPLYWEWLMVPVPCDEHFEIFWKVRDNYKPDHILPMKYYFTLYDIYNKVAVTQEIKDIKTKIETANLPSGNYIGHIVNEKQEIEKAAHIIIKH